MTKKLCLALMIGVMTGSVMLSAAPAAAMPVFDQANYAQNLMTAARTLQQINQQITSLQNEAQMLTNMDKHLKRVDFPELDKLKANLSKVDELMKQGDGIGFDAGQMEEQLRTLFPKDFILGNRAVQVADAKARLEAAIASFKKSMEVQSRIVANVQDDAAVLAELSARSSGAEGSLQAQQVTNQLLALAAKQQMQLQSMMAAEYRAASVDRARAAQSAAEARARNKRFLGDGKVYTPLPR